MDVKKIYKLTANIKAPKRMALLFTGSSLSTKGKREKRVLSLNLTKLNQIATSSNENIVHILQLIGHNVVVSTCPEIGFCNKLQHFVLPIHSPLNEQF